jgi:hypothetical protein
MKFVQLKIMNAPTRYIWIIISFDRAFEFGYGSIFKQMKWMQNLYQSMWDHEMLYAESSPVNKQLF